jgi:hypothetical protein
MSSTFDCCSQACPPVVPPVNIPGPAGASSATTTTAAFVVPAIGSDVVVQVLNTSQFVVGQSLIVSGPARFLVYQIIGPTTLTLLFQGLLGDVATGTVIGPGATVAPAGLSGAPGTNGQNGYTTTTGFTVPSAGGSVTFPVINSAPFVVGEYIIAAATGGPANFVVTSILNSNSITATFLSNTGDVSPGTAVPSGAIIASAGSAGQSAFTFLTAQITIPAKGTTVTAAVKSTAWIATGENVFISPNTSGAQGATFNVATIVSATSVTLTFLEYVNDLAPGNTIANGAVVTPSGTQPITGVNQTAYSSGAVYTLTGTPALLAFGGNKPTITLPTKGVWVIMGLVVYDGTFGGATAGQDATITTLLQRTNNSPGAVGNSSIAQNLYYYNSTILNFSDTVCTIPMFIYTTSTSGDIIQIWAAQVSTSGSVFTNAKQASLVAFQIG